jgi:OMF family outer membrane factor
VILFQTPALQLPTVEATKPLLRSPEQAQLNSLLQNRALTIEDAVTVSLLTSREFARSFAQLEDARGRTSEARAGLNPTLGLNGTYTAYTAPINANFGGAAIPIQRQYVGIYNAGVTLPIDISGTIRAAVSQAQFNEVAARIDVNRTRNDLVYNVRNAFYNALRQQGQLVVAEDSLRNTQERLQDAQSNLAAGTGTQFDVLTAQRDVADAQGNLVNARPAQEYDGDRRLDPHHRGGHQRGRGSWHLRPRSGPHSEGVVLPSEQRGGAWNRLPR